MKVYGDPKPAVAYYGQRDWSPLKRTQPACRSPIRSSRFCSRNVKGVGPDTCGTRAALLESPRRLETLPGDAPQISCAKTNFRPTARPGTQSVASHYSHLLDHMAFAASSLLYEVHLIGQLSLSGGPRFVYDRDRLTMSCDQRRCPGSGKNWLHQVPLTGVWKTKLASAHAALGEVSIHACFPHL